MCHCPSCFKAGGGDALIEVTTRPSLLTHNSVIAEASKELGEPMRGINAASLGAQELLAVRGW